MGPQNLVKYDPPPSQSSSSNAIRAKHANVPTLGPRCLVKFPRVGKAIEVECPTYAQDPPPPTPLELNIDSCITFYPLLEGTSSRLQDRISFCSGENKYQSKDGQLLVKFDTGENKFPLSETCFKSLILPIQHKEYLNFKKNMDIALNYGAKGFAFH